MAESLLTESLKFESQTMRKHNYGTKYNLYSNVPSLPCINVQLYILIRRVDLIILLDVVFHLSYTLLLSGKKEYVIIHIDNFQNCYKYWWLVNIHRGSFCLISCGEYSKERINTSTHKYKVYVFWSINDRLTDKTIYRPNRICHRKLNSKF